MTDDERTILGTPPLPQSNDRTYVRDFQRSLGVPSPGDPPLAPPFKTKLDPRGLVTTDPKAPAGPPKVHFGVAAMRLRLDTRGLQDAIANARRHLANGPIPAAAVVSWDEEHHWDGDQAAHLFEVARDVMRRSTQVDGSSYARVLRRVGRRRGTSGHRHAGTRAWAHRFCSHRRGRCSERRVKVPFQFWSATTADRP